ncbi:ABC transporter ATP-binding protein [Parapedobacter indicus]|uniref:Lipopolysaccharide transport system ATP-binding protein n=1 Tax=Parapedobacter indicus TaxID=1477437 RepID=A0A1I3MDE9_9SPHI|nr:ABC transporter ATP-binding protein [Parapedobacter indicus]PPL01202.1 lipopolysaccharide transport system ATP-binding protein [Parapedobacter indicus]SFI95003.1 lipopolysaccharide transport system ATP-binding protein [Parapedobacter indicus]
MSDILIQAENISKRYRLGVLNANTLKEDLSLWWQRKRKKQAMVNVAGDSYFWALKDINFEIRRGDVVGLIGKNGAGKSTLLKIISRIVLPTTGVVRGRGRIASLLEVGTGFHPELTGRENIFLNGNILGMKKKEIESRFDEIVDFSGIEAFLDTPVKRYSSGMYVRLAFSIAIHLEPDILVLDEVLSVGDFDFQQKCLAKIDEISKKQGQTILFVSHSMQSVKSLCDTVLYLEKGRLVAHGDASSVVSKYLLRENAYVSIQKFLDKSNAPGNGTIRIHEVEIRANDQPVTGVIDTQTDISVRFSFWNLSKGHSLLSVNIIVINFLGEGIFSATSEEVGFKDGLIHGICRIPKHFLADGSYVINLVFFQDKRHILFEFNQSLSFEVKSSAKPLNTGRWQAPVRPKLPFTFTQTT